MWWGGDEDIDDQESGDIADIQDIGYIGDIPDVSPEFQQCVSGVKWRLYETVIFGPELDTPQAQENSLVQVYVQNLEAFYRLLDATLRGQFKEAGLSALPAPRRSEVLQCVHALQKIIKAARHAGDLIPYREYLQEVLRVYPFVHTRNESE